ncbi:hypothetical protein CVT26_000995 [Gymnopilus dilepis]|uniref:Uncharacterized protein n=1 Tax=Gymnopilus dilepis TaxID=231916 RepID=A0A409YL66_9AGAR|nr:hypothetical protein CVT26_000995 [Gymnopilus dilepis]
MDPSYRHKKIVDLSDDEFESLAFLGNAMWMLSSRRRAWSSDAFTAINPDLISKYESKFWYHGISSYPPDLLWRSDLETNPIPHPPPGARFFKIPTKTAHGVFDTPLNNVWDNVAPKIIASMKDHGLKYSALKTARLLTLKDGEEEEMVGPVVVWIAVRPNTNTARAVRDATRDILHILADANVHGVVVEWCEGFGLNLPFKTGLGIPIARLSDDAQGTLTPLFREVEDNTAMGSPFCTQAWTTTSPTIRRSGGLSSRSLSSTPRPNSTA